MTAVLLPSVLVPFVSLLLAAPALAGPGAHPPTALWKAGEAWRISVKCFSPDGAAGEEAPAPVAHFGMFVAVVGTEQVEAVACWKVFFVCDNGVRADVGRGYYFAIDKQAGWPRKVGRVHGPCAATLETLGAGAIIKGAPKGIPLEFFPLPERPFQAKVGLATLAVERRVSGSDITLQATYRVGGKEVLMVRQKWAQGEKWWREHERYVNGRKDLHARITQPAVAAPAPPTRPTALTKAKLRPAGRWSPLSYDLRLQARLSLVETDPPLADVLQRLQEATGLSLTLGTGLERHDPQLGSMQMSNVPVWTIMHALSTKDLVNGRWEKVEDGYQLVADASLRERPLPPPFWNRTTILAASAGTLALLLAAWGGLFVRRRLQGRAKA